MYTWKMMKDACTILKCNARIQEKGNWVLEHDTTKLSSIVNLLEKGSSYKDLNTSYIIFICTFDPFQRGRALYKFRTTCEDEADTLELKDREYKLFLNSKGYKKAEDPDLAAFLQYIDGKTAEGKFTNEIAQAVQELQQSPMERRTYMLLSQVIKEHEDASFEKGVEYGKQEGKQEAKQETAYKLLALGIPLEAIAAGTGLPLEEIRKMAKKK